MNSGFTSERVYGALKKRLLGGEFRPGERLDPALLSDTLSSSVTPVRDVLNILRGEGLVETRTGEGFFRPHITAPDLEDLYHWSEQVLWLSVRHWRDAGDATPTVSDAEAEVCVAELFERIAARSGNAEHRRAIAGINDRLHAVRAIEDKIMPDTANECSAIEAAYIAADGRELSRLLSLYHRRRRRAASDIVRWIYRTA